MKTLFAVLLTILVAASLYTQHLRRESDAGVPVLYWVTDANPARTEQIRTFRNWLRKNGHPDFELRVDTVNSAPEKVVVQGVSGVCADLIDHSGGASLRFRQAVGLMEDVTEDAQRLKFDISQTYKTMEPDLTVDGRQYVFPCNVTSDLLWVNREVFEKAGMEPPPRRWTIEEFEAIGKELVARANEPGKLQRVFFVIDVQVNNLARTLGGEFFNETQTRCTINNDAFRRALELRYKWTYEDHIIPTAAERSSFSTMAGYGGSGLALFGSGNYAMVIGGRYLLIQFRVFSDERREEGRPPMSLSVSEWPVGSMPCSPVFTRATGVYAGGKHKELAKLFLAFLASEDYNNNIVNDADALPPNPRYVQAEEYLRPAGRPEEWGCHEVFYEVMDEQAIPHEFSPYVLDSVAYRIQNEVIDLYMNDMVTVDRALEMIEKQINDEIDRTLEETPSLRARYEADCELQSKIETLRQNNQPVPLAWINNPFLRRWYQHQGWTDTPATTTTQPDDAPATARN